MGDQAERSGQSFTLVQALRGVAASWVVLYHFKAGSHIDGLIAVLPRAATLMLFDAGHYGVAIFFALSGFVIAHSLRDVSPSWGFFGRFALRRSLRLDPPYWLSIVVVLALGWASARVKGEGFVWPDGATVLAHLFYLQVLLQRPEIGVVYWTLTYEVQFYLVLAGALVLARKIGARRPIIRPVLWGAMFGLAMASAAGLLQQAPSGLFVTLWASFFAGVLAYIAPHHRRAAAALAVLLGTMALAPGSDTFARISGATALLLAVTWANGWCRRGLDWAWLQFLGTISYSLYLLHNVVGGAAGFVAHRLLGGSLGGAIATLIVMVLAVLAGATAFWWSVERLAHRWSRAVPLAPRPAAQRKL